MSSNKIQHFLAIADVYTKLKETGKLRYFQVELREPFKHNEKSCVYAPDALFVHDKSIYLVEVQLSRMSRTQWSYKWKVANTYFNEGYYRLASWQRWKKADYIKPNFIVLSPQAPDIVREGFDVQGRELKISTELSTVL